MKYLVLSDIHANLEALEATLAATSGYERVLMLGDVVGYGADPNAVIDRLRSLPTTTVMIRGNHDKVAAGLASADGFNYIAREAIAWTAAVLTPDNGTWLAALPQGPATIDTMVEICHGTPCDEDVYVFDDVEAMRSLASARRPLCLFGHTHVPAAFRLDSKVSKRAPAIERQHAGIQVIGPPRGTSFTIELGERQHLVNCGAVGQPRDGDPRAAFGMLDTEARTITILRVTYDVAAAQAKIVAAGLPPVLAHRLAVGR